MSDQLQLLQAVDRRARETAASRFDRPLVLEAGAGTGKTAVLVARVLFWTLGPGWARSAAALGAAGGDVEAVAARAVERLVAVTFTDRAAAEMAERVGAGLGRLVGGQPVEGLPVDRLEVDADTRRVRARALLGCHDRLTVGTIHAFCRRLLMAHPLAAGLHPRFEVDGDGRAMRRVIEQVLADTLHTAYGDPHDEAFVELAAQGVGPAGIAEALELLADRSVAPDALCVAPYDTAAVRAAGRRLAGLLERWDVAVRTAVGDQPLSELPQISKALSSAGELARQAAQIERLDQLRALVGIEAFDRLLSRGGRWLRGDFGAEDVCGPEGFAALRAPQAALRSAVSNHRAIDPELLPRAARILGSLLAEVYRRAGAAGVQSFSGLLSRARDLLRDHPAVRRRVRASIDQLLVDEFQDTDPVQCELVELLALPDVSHPEGPMLMVVGDPKQSIYGWREADLAAYEAFTGRVEAAGGERHQLCVNFRSALPILDEVERIIAPVMRPEPGLQPAFQRLLAADPDRAGFQDGSRRPVEHWVSWSPPAGADDARTGPDTPAERARRIEAEAVAADLIELHRTAGVAWRQVGILLRTTTALETVLQPLRTLGIPFVVERDRSYYRRREVIEAAALLRVIVDPNDQLALVATLRSPVIGVPDAALVPLWCEQLPELVARLQTPAPEAIAAVFHAVDRAAAQVPADVEGLSRIDGWPVALKAGLAALAELRQAFVQLPADRFIELLRDCLLPEETEAARFLGAHRLANLERLFRRFVDGLAAGDADPLGVARELRSAVAEARAEQEATVGDESLDAVRVMTIHKAKGLTFDHVYVLGLHSAPGRGGAGGPSTEVVQLEDGQWSMRLLSVPDLAFNRVLERRREVAAAEAVRTLYVAATRPRQRLVLAGRWPDDDARAPEVAAARSHIDLLQHRRPRPLLGPAFARDRTEVKGDSALVRWTFCGRHAGGVVATADESPAALDVAEVEAQCNRLAELRDRARARALRSVIAPASGGWHRIERDEAHEAHASPPEGEGDRDRRLSLAVGSAVHRILETFDLSRPPDEELGRQRERVASYLADLGADDDDDARARAIERCERWLDRLGRGRSLARLYELAPAILGREVPLLLSVTESELHADDGPVGAVVGNIDLLYRDPVDQRLVIADYKTDRVDPDAGALRRRADRYFEQGRVYLDAVQRALVAEGQPPPRFELWFLRPDRIVPLSL